MYLLQKYLAYLSIVVVDILVRPFFNLLRNWPELVPLKTHSKPLSFALSLYYIPFRDYKYRIHASDYNIRLFQNSKRNSIRPST